MRPGQLALDSEQPILDVGHAALETEGALFRLDDLAVLLRELLLVRENLFVFLVQPLAKVQKLSARRTSRPGTRRKLCPELVDLASSPTCVGRVDPQALELAARVLQLTFCGVEALARGARLAERVADDIGAIRERTLAGSPGGRGGPTRGRQRPVLGGMGIGRAEVREPLECRLGDRLDFGRAASVRCACYGGLHL